VGIPQSPCDQLSMSVAERRRSRTAQQAFWSFPTKNTRDRAAAVEKEARALLWE
jgi:hypothetical protein